MLKSSSLSSLLSFPIFSYPLQFWLAALAGSLSFLSLTLILVPLPLYVQEIGGDPAQIGLVVGIAALSSLLSRPYVGRMVDLRGKKPVLLVGIIIFIITPLLYGLANSIPLLLLVRFIQGFAISTVTTAMTPLLADMVSPGRRGAALGLAAGFIPVAVIIGPPIGSGIQATLGFFPLFIAASLGSVLALLLVLPVAEPPRSEDDPPETKRESFSEVLRWRGVWVPSLLSFVRALAWGAIVSFLPLFALASGIDNPGLFFTGYGVAFMLGTPVVGRLSDRWGRVAVIVPLMGVLAAGLFFLSNFADLAGFLLAAALVGVGMGGTSGTMDALVVDSVPPRARGSSIGVVYGSFDLGVLLGSALGGFSVQALGYGGTYAFLAFTTLLVTAAFWGLMRHR